ncbi:MAG TPA: 3-oxoacyl-[acyl-carrier-protein] synthase III C-terminal domain-containing protein [Terriglobales bacterium]|nr:3-oxoacyl-[acyl-carrier-protein] synthase III C-terminal domain-containing protein [Terriglobales bacterium]
MKIVSAATAFPQHRYAQREIAAALAGFWGDRVEKPEFIPWLHARTGVEHRHLVLPLAAYERLTTWGQINSLWIEAAHHLGRAALCKALTAPGLTPRELGALFFVTVTGVASPSIDAKLANSLHMSPNVKRVPIFGLGCVAGAAGLARAADYVRAFPDQVAALVSVELCSLTWQRDDVSMANLISTGLFGDGAAAVLVAGSATPFDGPQILATRSIFYPGTEDVMGWNVSERGFRIVLSPDVPQVIREHLRADVDAFLAEHGLSRERIAGWIIHTGGPKVLDAVQDALALPDGALERSWDCLRRVGNLSSASVLMVLEEVLAAGGGEPGTYSVLAAMGPGFCSELLLLRW